MRVGQVATTVFKWFCYTMTVVVTCGILWYAFPDDLPEYLRISIGALAIGIMLWTLTKLNAWWSKN